VKQALALFSLATTLLLGRVAGAVPVVEDKEKGIAVNVGALLQPQFQMTGQSSFGGHGACGSPGRPGCSTGIGSARGDGPNYDLFLRRARLMLWGSATKQISFFIETDEPNLGKNGDFSVRTFVQDAFLTYTVIPEFKVDAGLMLAPLTHHTLEGATSLNALDYHSDMIKLPAGRVFRDAGVQFRGLALQDHLGYRLAIFEGVRNSQIPGTTVAAGAPAGTMAPPRSTLNPGGVPRLTGMIRANILGSEPDFFLKGIYFAEKPIISLGIGGDWQSKSAMKLRRTENGLGYNVSSTEPTGAHTDYIAASIDAFVDYPFTAADELIVKANYLYYGEGAVPGAVALPGTYAAWPGASAIFGEVGFRHGILEPIAYIEYMKARMDAYTSVAPHGGLNVWVMKHNFNIKTDLGWKKTEQKNLETMVEARTKKDLIWTTQAQLFF
jgi:hypothetical protein